MLTTTTVLMSLGMETRNARPAPSGREDSGGISFAESFDEGAPLGGAVQQVADSTMLKGVVDSKAIVPVKHADVSAAAADAKTNANDGGKIQDQLEGAKRLISGAMAKVVAASLGEEKVTANVVLPNGVKPNQDISGTLQVETPKGQPPFAGAKDGTQKLPDPVDATKTEATDQADPLQTDVSAVTMPSIPGGDTQAVVQDQKYMATALTKQVAKGHDSIEKTDKTGKTTKTEKTDKSVGKTEAVVGSEPQIVIAIPVSVPSGGGQQQKISAVENDVDLSSVASATAGRSIGMSAVTDSKTGKKTAGTRKAAGDDFKTLISVPADDTSLKKPETDLAKATTPVPAAADSGIAKAQNAVEAGAGMALTHAEAGTAGGISAIMPGIATVHVAVHAPGAVETSSHAVAMQAVSGIQVGTGGSDTAGPGDATHRTLMATPTALEVGVANGTHGWLKIRAEMTGGGVVNASLSTASSSGQEMLHRELPSLTAYLQSERVAVNTVVVQAAVAAAGTDFRGLAGGMNGDGRGQAPQNGSQGGESRQDSTGTVINRMEKEVSYNRLSGVGGEELLPRLFYVRGGSWLSVRA